MYSSIVCRSWCDRAENYLTQISSTWLFFGARRWWLFDSMPANTRHRLQKKSLPWTVDHLSIMMPDMVDSFLALRFCSSLERCVAALASGPSCLFSSLWSKIPMGNSDMGIIFAQACFLRDAFFHQVYRKICWRVGVVSFFMELSRT